MGVSLSLLGSFEASVDGRPLRHFRSNRTQALLIYLATESALGATIFQREFLMDLLWPGLPLKSAQVNLRQTLYQLRQAIPSSPSPEGIESQTFLLTDRQTVQVNPDFSLKLDVADFLQFLNGHQSQWPEAVALYRNDFLSGFFLPDANTFEQWASVRRAAFRRQMLDTLASLSSLRIEHNIYDEAETFARRQLELDPLREQAYRQLMTLLARSGRRSEALALYEQCRRVLQDELSIDPSAKTQALLAAIRAGKVEEAGSPLERDIDADRHPSALDVHRTTISNIPVQMTPFIGRKQELAALKDLLANPDMPLITIVGPGGIGKTRLALELAASAADSFPDGAFFVPLAQLSVAEHIVPAVADSLQFSCLGIDQPQQQLVNYLHQKRMMLVLDSFEHVLENTAILTEIRHAATGVKMLITSRERLNLSGESVFPIGGMSYPESERLSETEINNYDAVMLLLNHIRQVRPQLDLQTEELEAIVRISRLVHGMPLASILAAGWLDVLSLPEIADEIARNLDFLETEARDLPERQRSVRAAFDYSWKRLSSDERDAFMKLSVFRGGFTRPAGQTVTGASLRLLRTLINKSLLEHEQSRDRFQFHELLRQYGAEKLAENEGLEEDVRNRHSSFYCQLLHNLEDDLKGSRQQEALAEIEADIVNVQSAWQWALAGGNFKHLLLAMDTLGHFYEWRGRYKDGESTFASLATTSIGETAKPGQPLLAKALIWQSVFQLATGDIEMAQTTLGQVLERAKVGGPEQKNREVSAFGLLRRGQLSLGRENEAARADFLSSLDQYRSVGKQWETARAQQGLGEALWRLGAFNAGRKELEACLAIRRSLGDLLGLAHVTLLLSSLARYQGRGEDALTYAEECLEICQRLGNRLDTAVAMSNLAIIQGLIQGRFSQAYRLQQQGMAISDELNDLPQLCLGHGRQGMFLRFQGDFERAQEHADQGIAIAREINHRHYLAYLYLREGQALIGTGENDEAQRLLSESLTLYRQASVIDQMLVALVSLTYSQRYAIGMERVRKQLLSILKTHLEEKYFYPVQDAIQFIILMLLERSGPAAETSADRKHILAFELVGMLSQFPAMRAYFKHFPAFRPILEAEAELPSDLVAAAKSRGHERDIWEAGAELLEELPTLGWPAPDSDESIDFFEVD